MIKTETLIIGAGPCGLALGHKLTQNKKDFLIVEKSRGIGGRIATRRIDGDSFDHGQKLPDLERIFFLPVV
jgi:renalase